MRPSAEPAQVSALDEQAQVGHISFNEGESTISTGEEKDLNEFSQAGGLCRVELPVEFEGNKVVLCCGWALPGAEVVLAVGEKDGVSAEGLAIAEVDHPVVVRGGELVHEGATFYDAATLLGECDEGVVEGETGKRERGEGQRRLDDAVICGEAERADGGGTELHGINADLAEILDSLRT